MTEQEIRRALGPGAVFPIGGPNTAYAQYFTGDCWLAPLTKDVPIGNVTFAPGCINNWHIHHGGGQLLLVTAGEGWYQEWGKEARHLTAGDVVEIPAEVKHWHGAARDSWFQHLAVEVPGENRSNEWLEPVDPAAYAALPGGRGFVFQPAADTGDRDPEYREILERFLGGQVAEQTAALTERQKLIVLGASLTALGTPTVLEKLAVQAVRDGLDPLVLRESIYHAGAYCGAAKALEALAAFDRAMERCGVALPLENCATVTAEDRMEKGFATQVGIFGDHIRDNYKNAPEGQLHIQEFLSANCFGDYYTRTCLDIPERELCTFAAIASLGGCEAQLGGHTAGNLAVGNSKEVLVVALSLLVTFIGYPRTLNALAVVNRP